MNTVYYFFDNGLFTLINRNNENGQVNYVISHENEEVFAGYIEDLISQEIKVIKLIVK